MLTPTTFLRQLLYLVLPHSCLECHAPLVDDPVPFFCEHCWNAITPIPHPTCPTCSRPFSSPIALTNSSTHRCGTCRTNPPPFTKAWTIYPYQSPLKEAICQFKYRGKVNLAKPLAELMARELSIPPNLDFLIPVPLAADRIRQREFNQALLLADQLGPLLHRPVFNRLLIRIRSNPPQTTLKRKARLQNLRKSFAVTSPSQIKGKCILLIDDVLTTGTTISECSKTLLRSGAQEVYVATLARMI
jgi:ComF family protein